MRWVVAALCIGWGLVPLSSRAADVPPVVGSVGAVSGRARVAAPGMPGEAVLGRQDLVREGQTVRTDADSRLQLQLLDGSTLSLGGGTELRLDHLTTFAAPAPSSVFTLLGGYLRAAITPLQSGNTFEVRTPSMVAGVRGTEWIERHLDGRTEMYVFHGAVQVGNAQPQENERKLLIQAGRGLDFGQNGPVSPIRRWRPQRIAAFVDETALPEPPVPPDLPADASSQAGQATPFGAPGKTPDALPAPAVP